MIFPRRFVCDEQKISFFLIKLSFKLLNADVEIPFDVKAKMNNKKIGKYLFIFN